MERLHEFDLSLFRAINVGMHQPWLDPFFAFFSYLGLGGVCGAVCLLFLLNKSTRAYVLPLLIADAVGGILVADGLKQLIPRDRPSHLSFAIRQEPHLFSSFPSGHTTTAFSIGCMLYLITRGTPRAWWGQASLVVALLIGFSRIYRGVHWPTDVLGGALCGLGTACALYLLFPKLVTSARDAGNSAEKSGVTSSSTYTPRATDVS